MDSLSESYRWKNIILERVYRVRPSQSAVRFRQAYTRKRGRKRKEIGSRIQKTNLLSEKREKMASGLVLRSPAGVSGLCKSSFRSGGVEHVSSFARSAIFGEIALPSFCRSDYSIWVDGARTSPALLCVAVVWWSDAAKKLKPEWEKAYLMRVEKLNASSVPENAPKAESEEDYILQWTELLKSKTMALVSAGLTPEVIIGRMAMLGFLAATTVEVETGKSVLQQLTIRGEVASVVVATTVVAMSLLLHKKYTKEDGSSAIFNPFGLFTPTAELMNGQAAMLGFILLVATELAKGSALF